MYIHFCIYIKKCGKRLNITRAKYKKVQTIAQEPGEGGGGSDQWSSGQLLLGFSALGDPMMLIARTHV